MHRAPKVIEARGVDCEFEAMWTVDVAPDNTKRRSRLPVPSGLTGPGHISCGAGRAHSGPISVS